MIRELSERSFLLTELIKRDFKKKYKRSYLGALWSLISPLLSLLVMRLVFTHLFGRGIEHYTTYLFCGNLIFAYFNESSTQGMSSILSNANIFSKVSVKEYLFLLSKNAQTFINFLLTLSVFFVFCIIDGITFGWRFFLLIYPVLCLAIFNIGVGAALSSMYVFFRDIQYLWTVFLQLLMYVSAIFYSIDSYPEWARRLFNLNPIYLFISYFRKVVIEGITPPLWHHTLILLFTVLVALVGWSVYRKSRPKFLYYV